jgi:hypothetical protein
MIATSKLALMIVTVTAAIVSAPARAGAQGGPVPINSGTLAKFIKASSNFASYMKQHPADANLDDASYDNETEAAKAICGPRPGVKQAIAAGGLTCIQWVTLTAELEKAGSAAAMVKTGQKVPSEFGVSPADIDFYNKHTAEIKLALEEISAGNDTQ